MALASLGSLQLDTGAVPVEPPVVEQVGGTYTGGDVRTYIDYPEKPLIHEIRMAIRLDLVGTGDPQWIKGPEPKRTKKLLLANFILFGQADSSSSLAHGGSADITFAITSDTEAALRTPHVHISDGHLGALSGVEAEYTGAAIAVILGPSAVKESLTTGATVKESLSVAPEPPPSVIEEEETPTQYAQDEPQTHESAWAGRMRLIGSGNAQHSANEAETYEVDIDIGLQLGISTQYALAGGRNLYRMNLILDPFLYSETEASFTNAATTPMNDDEEVMLLFTHAINEIEKGE